MPQQRERRATAGKEASGIAEAAACSCRRRIAARTPISSPQGRGAKLRLRWASRSANDRRWTRRQRHATDHAHQQPLPRLGECGEGRCDL